MTRVGVKFCGGCNPAIDRVGTYREILAQANGLTFTALGDQDLGAYLFICGCATACPIEQFDFYGHPRLVVVAGESVDGRAIPAASIASAVLTQLREHCGRPAVV